MTEAPLISVVVPSYNARPWIAATLQSVLAQCVGPLQVVVVDDGPQDGTAAFVQQAFPQVQVLQQPNAGVAAARNRGLAAAQGQWVAFIDADDIWLPGKLAAQLAALQAQPQARMVYTAWQVWESDAAEPSPQWLHTLPAHKPGPSGDIYADLLLECAVWTSTVLAHRALLQQLGGFDESLAVGEDYDLWLRASRLTPVLRVPQPLALYRQHPKSLTRRAPARNWQALVVERAIQQWGYAGPGGRRAEPAAVRRALATSWRDFANYFPAPARDIELGEGVFGEFVPWGNPQHTDFFPMRGEALEWLKQQWRGWRRTGMRLAYRPNYLHDGWVMPLLDGLDRNLANC